MTLATSEIQPVSKPDISEGRFRGRYTSARSNRDYVQSRTNTSQVVARVVEKTIVDPTLSVMYTPFSPYHELYVVNAIAKAIPSAYLPDGVIATVASYFFSYKQFDEAVAQYQGKITTWKMEENIAADSKQAKEEEAKKVKEKLEDPMLYVRASARLVAPLPTLPAIAADITSLFKATRITSQDGKELALCEVSVSVPAGTVLDRGSDDVFVVDVSMSTCDRIDKTTKKPIPGTGFNSKAISTLTHFINEKRSGRFALIIFAEDQELVIPLELATAENKAKWIGIINDKRALKPRDGETNIVTPLQHAVDMVNVADNVDRSHGISTTKTIYLLTDGENRDPIDHQFGENWHRTTLNLMPQLAKSLRFTCFGCGLEPSGRQQLRALTGPFGEQGRFVELEDDFNPEDLQREIQVRQAEPLLSDPAIDVTGLGVRLLGNARVLDSTKTLSIHDCVSHVTTRFLVEAPALKDVQITLRGRSQLDFEPMAFNQNLDTFVELDEPQSQKYLEGVADYRQHLKAMKEAIEKGGVEGLKPFKASTEALLEQLPFELVTHALEMLQRIDACLYEVEEAIRQEQEAHRAIDERAKKETEGAIQLLRSQLSSANRRFSSQTKETYDQSFAAPAMSYKQYMIDMERAIEAKEGIAGLKRYQELIEPIQTTLPVRLHTHATYILGQIKNILHTHQATEKRVLTEKSNVKGGPSIQLLLCELATADEKLYDPMQLENLRHQAATFAVQKVLQSKEKLLPKGLFRTVPGDQVIAEFQKNFVAYFIRPSSLGGLVLCLHRPATARDEQKFPKDIFEHQGKRYRVIEELFVIQKGTPDLFYIANTKSPLHGFCFRGLREFQLAIPAVIDMIKKDNFDASEKTPAQALLKKQIDGIHWRYTRIGRLVYGTLAIYQNYIVKPVKWTVSQVYHIGSQFVSGTTKVIQGLYRMATGPFRFLYNRLLVPAATWTGRQIYKMLSAVFDAFISVIDTVCQAVITQASRLWNALDRALIAPAGRLLGRISDGIAATYSVVANAVTRIFETVSKVWTTFIVTPVKWAGRQVMKMISGAANGISTIYHAVINAAFRFWNALDRALIVPGSRLLGRISDGIAATYSAVVNTITSIFTTVSKGWSTFIVAPVQWAGRQVMKMISGAATGISTIYSAVINAAACFLNAFDRALIAPAGRLLGRISGGFATAYPVITNAISGVYEAVSKVIRSIVSTLVVTPVEWIGRQVMRVLSTAHNGITDAIASVYQAVMNLLSALLNQIGSGLNRFVITPVGEMLSYLGNLGSRVCEATGNGLSRLSQSIVDPVARCLKAVGTAINTVAIQPTYWLLRGVYNIGSTLISGTAKAVNGVFLAIYAQAAKLVGSIVAPVKYVVKRVERHYMMKNSQKVAEAPKRR
ncbi:MAG: VWA domain-containing protein [Parachlamydiaceae bacterium]|nr:VWA domain-containing protein [Parachlamydiaceae bacterium]